MVQFGWWQQGQHVPRLCSHNPLSVSRVNLGLPVLLCSSRLVFFHFHGNIRRDPERTALSHLGSIGSNSITNTPKNKTAPFFSFLLEVLAPAAFSISSYIGGGLMQEHVWWPCWSYRKLCDSAVGLRCRCSSLKATNYQLISLSRWLWLDTMQSLTGGGEWPQWYTRQWCWV